MIVVECIYPIGPWLTMPVTAIVEGTAAEIAALGDLVTWRQTYTRVVGEIVRAHLTGVTSDQAGRIMAIPGAS